MGGSVIDKTFEMGTFNWEYKHMKPYQYAWGASFKDANLPWKHGESDFIDQIIKVDLMQNATVASWSRQGFFCLRTALPAEARRRAGGRWRSSFRRLRFFQRRILAVLPQWYHP